jgi:hypothetical protein
MDNQIAQIWGDVDIPPGVINWGNFGPGGGGPSRFFNALLRTMIVGAGLYALLNFIFAGYGFLSAGGDAKKIADAWAKIWQSAIGLAVAVGSFVLAAIFGQLIFGDYNALLQLRVFGP